MRLFEGTPFDIPPKCDRCGALEAECRCPPPPRVFADPSSQTARLALEKRKKGKMVTVVRGLSAVDNDLDQLLTRLKNHCGAGGTCKDDELELQGDHVARVRSLLTELGFRVR